MNKNVASQKVTFLVIDISTNAPKTGDAANLTAYVSKDDGTVTVLGDTSATELDATNAPGLYAFDLTQAETNADKLVFSGKSATANIRVIPLLIYTTPASFSAFVTPTGAAVNVTQFGGSNITSASGIPEVKVASIAANAITATAIAADAITDAKVASDVTIASVTGAVGSVTGAVGSVTGAVGSVTGNVGGNVTGSVGSVAAGGISAGSFAAGAIDAAAIAADAIGASELAAGAASEIATAVRTELATELGRIDAAITTRAAAALFTGITSVAEWLGLIAGKQTGNSTARTEIRATGAGSGTYDETTDSQEATRDRGDAAWTTATGFSTHSAADVWAVATRTLTAFDSSFKTGYALSSAGVQAIWDALTSALTTVGSIGKLLVDNVNATISSRLPTSSYTAPLDASGTRSALGLASANLDTQLDALPTNSELATALAVADDAVLAAVSGLSIPTADENADALLDRTNAIETGVTLRGAQRLMLAALAGKLSGADTTTVTFRNAVADSKDRIVATVTSEGNRTAITTDQT